jgi:transcriptional regulator with XRE-family HTH domain
MALNLGRFEALMKRQKLENKDIAAKMGISGHTVYRWSTGATQPTSFNLSRLADILKTSSDYLLDLTNDPAPRPTQVDLNEKEFLIIDAYRRGDLREIMRLLGGDEG